MRLLFKRVSRLSYFLWFGFLVSAWGEPGDVEWSFQTGGEVFGSAAVAADGSVFVGSRDGKLYALRPDGSEKWSFAAGDWVDSAPTLNADEGEVYFGSWDNKLYALDAGTGEKRWEYSVGSLIVCSPALDAAGNLFFGSSDGIFYSLDSEGELRWFYFIGTELDASPAVSEEGYVYVGAYDGILYSFTNDGDLRWEFAAREQEDESGARIAGPISIGDSGEVYFGSADGFCYCVSSEGEMQWEFDTFEKVDTGVVIGEDGTLVVASRSGKVYSLDSFGVPIWESYVGDVFFSTPAIDSQGRIYVGSYVGNGVSAMNALNQEGEIVWNHLVFDFIDSPPVFDADGRVIYGSYDGSLYALEASASDALSDWGQFGAGSANQGRRVVQEVAVLSARYGEWVETLDLKGVFADPCFDAEGDGYALALEYLLGGDPTEFDRVGFSYGSEDVSGEKRLWLEYNRVLGDSEVSYVLEYSGAEGQWSDLMDTQGVEEVLVDADLLDAGWYERVRVLLPAELSENALFRLRMACD